MSTQTESYHNSYTHEEDASSLTLATFAERAYLDYAISVVKGRALPEVSDGQKPVQRRILFAMHALGLSASAKPRKSALVVGEVLGKLHPHGDQSVYDALVRMTQDFALRYPLIDGQGNFGSRDGDGAAAMRYTEARLTPIAQLLLDEIDMGTVSFQANYDGSTEEPQYLPARLPIILLNGASGIAVGLATEIPAHNLCEVAQAAIALIKKPSLTHEECMEILPGPDFPGGGHIISTPAALSDIYQTGRGSMTVRARYQIEELARGQWQIVITELPPNTSSQKILEEIEECINPKIKLGKKSLTSEQQHLKQLMLGVLDTVRDESGKEAAIRLVFVPKSKNQSSTETLHILLAHTSLETNVSTNLVMIGQDGKPKQKGLLTILSEWVDFRFQTVTRRTHFRLDKVRERIHILEGRLTVLLHIDRVIQIIRESDEPKVALIAAFGLSERQADDILDIRLRQLARLEHIKLEQELHSLQKERDDCEALLGQPNLMKRKIIKEIEEDQKRFGDKRRTLIAADSKTTVEKKIVDEPITVIVSQKGWLRTRLGHQHAADHITFKSGDALYQTFECRSIDYLLAFSNNGRVYAIPISQLPGAKGDGEPVTRFITLNVSEHIVHYFAGAIHDLLLLSTNQGMGLTAHVADMISRTKNGKAFMQLPPDALLLPPRCIKKEAQALACLSEQGRLLLFDIRECKYLANGGKGVTLMTLAENETLLPTQVLDKEPLIVRGIGRGGKQQAYHFSSQALLPYCKKRAHKGREMAINFTPTHLDIG